MKDLATCWYNLRSANGFSTDYLEQCICPLGPLAGVPVVCSWCCCEGVGCCWCSDRWWCYRGPQLGHGQNQDCPNRCKSQSQHIRTATRSQPFKTLQEGQCKAGGAINCHQAAPRSTHVVSDKLIQWFERCLRHSLRTTVLLLYCRSWPRISQLLNSAAYWCLCADTNIHQHHLTAVIQDAVPSPENSLPFSLRRTSGNRNALIWRITMQSACQDRT